MLLAPLLKSVDHMDVFLSSISIPSIAMSILISVPFCLDYCCLIVIFEIGEYQSTVLFLFFRIVLAAFESLMNFRVSFVSVYNEARRDSDGDCIESVDHFGEGLLTKEDDVF